MALKAKITKAEFEKLGDALKAEYVEDGEGYRLDVDGIEDPKELKRAKDREIQLRKDAEKRAKEAEDKLSELDSDDARKKGDIETLEKKWKGDLDAEKAAHKATTEKFQNAFKKSLIDAKATEIATKISKVPSLLSRVIRDRLTVDFDGDEPTTRVIGADGKVDEKLTLDDLTKELVANKEYADIIIASKASGGAAKTTQNGGGAANNPGHNGHETADYASMKPSDLAAAMKEKVEARKSANQ